MSVIELDFYDGDDPHGALLGTLTDAECSAIPLRVALRGIGAGSFSISRSHPLASATLIRKGNYVRVTIPSIQAEPVWAFWLWEGSFNLLDHSGDDTLTFSGPGALGVLRDGILHSDHFAPAQPARGSDNKPGLWWWINEPYGAILTRIIEEGQYEPGTPLSPVTIDFDRDFDSAAVAWPNIDTEYQQPIQTNLLKVFEDLRDAGDMFVVSDPDLLIQAFQTYGTDRTSATFAAGKVRLTDTNILTALSRRIHATNEGTHLLVRDKDGAYSAEVHPAYTTERGRWLSLDVPETNDPGLLTKIGQESLTSSTLNTDAFEAEVTPGDDELTGRYLPWLHYNIGDTITVDAGIGPYAYVDADAQIVAFRVELDEASDDTTDDTAHRSLHTVLELNAAQSEGAPIEGRPIGFDVLRYFDRFFTDNSVANEPYRMRMRDYGDGAGNDYYERIEAARFPDVYLRLSGNLDLHSRAGGGMDIEADGGMDIDAGGGMNVRAGGGMNIASTGGMDIRSQDALEIVAPNDDITFKTPDKHRFRAVGGGDESLGIVVPIRTADPAGGSSEDGQVYYNSVSDTFRGRVNGAWIDLGGDFSAHTGDTSDAHDSSAVSFVPVGTIAATDAQSAIAEVATDAATALTTHTADATDAHAATAIGFTPTGATAATDTQAAIVEVAADSQARTEKGAASGYASLGADTLVPQDQLGTGTQDGTKFLRDDGTWQTVAASGDASRSFAFFIG